MEKHYATGIMSGTSLDGMDIAWCCFRKDNRKWNYEILYAQTLPYPQQWITRLREAPLLNGNDLIKLHFEYGDLIGQMAASFISKNKIANPGVIASHGHTVFHRPDSGYTFQAGHGANIAARTRQTVVCDFRSLDVTLGGQGAPLVPIGDHHLFSEYDYCLNLGGFANISFIDNKKRVAFDICPANYVINKYIREAAIEASSFTPLPDDHPRAGTLQYDPSGKIASQGNIDQNLLLQLNNIDFYSSPGPKSLGEEWLNENFFPILENKNLPLPDLLRTIYEHIAVQIAAIATKQSKQTMLVTGGGAYNAFLISLLRSHLPAGTKVVIPSAHIISFKEALVFAFLGVLRMQNLPNCLSAVTGSLYNNIGGSVFQGFHL